LLACGIALGWVLAVCFCQINQAAICLSLSLSDYLSAVYTVWKDVMGVGRMLDAAGIPLITAPPTGGGAAMAWNGCAVINLSTNTSPVGGLMCFLRYRYGWRRSW